MDKLLMRTLKKDGLKMNEDIGNGLSRPYMAALPEYLSSVFNSAMKTLTPDIKLEYKGYRKLTPLEDFYNGINASATKNSIDISRSYLYKVEYGFEYNGIPINRVLALPFVTRGGYLKLSDSHYAITPVLSEYPLSPAPGEIFIRILRDKLNIKKMYRKILINNEKQSVQVVHSRSYKLVDKVNDMIPVALYGFLKYGFKGLFKSKFNADIIAVKYTDTTDETYGEKYNIYRSTGVKPRTINILNYSNHDVAILVEKKDVTPVLEVYIASLIYSMDLSPMFAANLPNVIGDISEPTTYFDYSNISDESLFWITLLGKVIFKNKYTTDRIQVDTLEHINILNGYLDSIVKIRLEDINIYVDDIYDLLLYAIDNFNELVLAQESHSSKVSNRYIDLEYYILYDLIVGINKAFLEIKRAAKRNRIGEVEITRIFNMFLPTKKIYRIIKSSATNIAIAPIESTSDNMYFKMTSILEDQNRAQGVNKSKKNVFPINTRSIRGEDIMFGSILHQIKKYPSPRFRFNPFVNIDINKGKFIFTDQQLETISKIDTMLSDTSVNKEISENEVITEINLDL